MKAYNKYEVDEIFSSWQSDLDQLDVIEVYTKSDIMAMLEELRSDIEKLKNEPHCCEHYVRGTNNSSNIIQQKIDMVKCNGNLVVECDQCVQSFDKPNKNQRYYDKDSIWDCIVHSEINDIKHHIKVLEKLLKETKGKIELYSKNKDIDINKEKEIVETLGYAISSLKTNLKYVLMYDKEEMYTKDQVVDMLTELKTEIDAMSDTVIESRTTITITSWKGMQERIVKLIQSKIEGIKEKQ